MNRLAVPSALVFLLASAAMAFALQPSAIPMGGLRMLTSAGSVEIEGADRYDAAENAGVTLSDTVRQSDD